MGTVGVLGAPWRADVSMWGAVTPWDGSPTLDWYVAADDRWHVPSAEQAVRQSRLDGTPVFETRLKVPGGDAVHRVYAVADGGGATVIEVENDSSLPFAVAFSRSDLLTSRPPAAVPIEGIDLPEGSIVLPVGHRSTLRVALAHDGRGAGALPDDLPGARAVVRGWLAATERASRLVLPDTVLVDAFVAARCDAALGAVDDPEHDPVGFVLGVCEAVRIGERPDAVVPELAAEVERLARSAARDSGLVWDLDRAIVAFGEVLSLAGDRRAVGDLGDLRRRLGRSGARPDQPPAGVRTVAWVEDLLVRPELDGSCTLMPDGLPASWLGVNFEVYRLPGGGGHHVSFALRWHGERPALLWEVSGPVGLMLRAGGLDPAWCTSDAQGEALLAVPPGATATPESTAASFDAGSFS